MLSEALTALAAAGGTALVGAMATDAWATARAGVTKLFHRTDAGRQTAVQTQLDNTVALVERAPDLDRDQARAALAGLWQMELSRLLDEHPDAELDLTTLIAQIREELPAEQQLWVQNNTARDHGQVFASQGGNVIVHQTLPTPGTAGDQDSGDIS